MLNQPDVKKKIAEQGGDVVAETPEQFAAFIKAETAKWGKVVKDWVPRSIDHVTINIRAYSARLMVLQPFFL